MAAGASTVGAVPATAARAALLVARLGYRASPSLMIAGVVLVPISSAFAAATGLGFKMLADAYVSGSETTAWRAAGFLAVATFAVWFATNIGALLRMTLTERVGHELQKHVSVSTASVPGLDHLEDSELRDRLELVNRDGFSLSYLASTAVHALSAVGQLVFATALLATVSPILVLLPLVSVPTLVASRFVQRRKREIDESLAEDLRLSLELHQLVTTTASAKEILACNLSALIAERRREASLRMVEGQRRGEVLSSLYLGIGTFVAALGYVAAVAFVAVRATRGGATPGEVLLTVALASQFTTIVGGLLTHVRSLADMLTTAERVAWISAYAGALRRRNGSSDEPPMTLKHGIDLHGVDYEYRGTETPALSGVDLHIDPGSVVALVGENGAGKSTLVKLLCRMYTPTAGRIEADGIDLQHLDADDWTARVSASYQDFARLELLLGEAVGVGDLHAIDDDDAIDTALERADGASIRDAHQDGLRTQLGSMWPKGTDLSTGQWQKVALARALMRGNPLVLVLDEPSASLDAASEHALFERFAVASAAHTSAGGITVLVSHRFSTVAMADTIVVMEGGRVVEHGDHEALMGAGGLYAELYTIQARAYA